MSEKMFYLLGNPLGHSWSVPIHNRLADYSYQLRLTTPEELDSFLRERDFGGLNVTIPHKKAVIPYCDELTDTAQKIGAVNTVYFADGRMIGHNTDYAGFAYLARRAGISFAGRRVYILGSGGTSLTARAVAEDEGAAAVTVVSRSGDFGYDDLYAAHGEFILINTTPVGMYPHTDACPVDLDRLPDCRGVLDVVYNPRRTRLVQAALERGIPAAGGLAMLVAQAAYASEKFAGRQVSEDAIETTLAAITQECANIVLIGMPGCGKSTVGRCLAELTGRELIDTDARIEERAGKPIPQIFAEDGEAAFRALEADVIAELGRERGLIIACGGGAVLKPENRIALRQNGRIYCLRRPLELLETKGRPLSGNLEKMRALESVRAPIYREMTDLSVENITTPADAAAAIWKDFLQDVN
ncbi:MAG: shikimate kinase [Clostridia bacterium]|nr:shikimate kinase [Clostridia bacterium]